MERNEKYYCKLSRENRKITSLIRNSHRKECMPRPWESCIPLWTGQVAEVEDRSEDRGEDSDRWHTHVVLRTEVAGGRSHQLKPYWQKPLDSKVAEKSKEAQTIAAVSYMFLSLSHFQLSPECLYFRVFAEQGGFQWTGRFRHFFCLGQSVHGLPIFLPQRLWQNSQRIKMLKGPELHPFLVAKISVWVVWNKAANEEL